MMFKVTQTMMFRVTQKSQKSQKFRPAADGYARREYNNFSVYPSIRMAFCDFCDFCVTIIKSV